MVANYYSFSRVDMILLDHLGFPNQLLHPETAAYNMV